MRLPQVLGLVVVLLISGCTSYGVIQNEPLQSGSDAESYSIRGANFDARSGDISLILAFSGGGTRAAALAYGVLQELRDTGIAIAGRDKRLLDEVDIISSVSGGSFTSAYYGLYGDRVFDDFEEVFLRRDVEGSLLRGLFNPGLWFSRTGRTEMAVKFYEQNVFGGATFADLKAQDGPLILINASDLGYGVRFSFAQEYFNLLCSDISTFPVARAVTASSAVPVLFHPVVMENHDECKNGTYPDWLLAAKKNAQGNEELRQVVSGLGTYFDTDRRKYAHFVDGGITDNLGLRAIYEVIEIVGGIEAFMRKTQRRRPPSHAVIVSVNASTDPEPTMDLSNVQPSMAETINAMSDIQLHRYNAATIALMDNTLQRWAKELSTPSRKVTSHFIQVDFRDIEDPETRRFFNRVPTSFNLTEEQVDRLILAGRELLRSNPEFQLFLAELNKSR